MGEYKGKTKEEYQREYYLKNKEKKQQYYQDNTESVKIHRKEYYKSNRDYVNQYQLLYYHKKKLSKSIKGYTVNIIDDKIIIPIIED
jgi:hypothetical protein